MADSPECLTLPVMQQIKKMQVSVLAFIYQVGRCHIIGESWLVGICKCLNWREKCGELKKRVGKNSAKALVVY